VASFTGRLEDVNSGKADSQGGRGQPMVFWSPNTAAWQHKRCRVKIQGRKVKRENSQTRTKNRKMGDAQNLPGHLVNQTISVVLRNHSMTMSRTLNGKKKKGGDWTRNLT